jgi:nucleotidyltransferase/DNA polymerase involved in DNA repair
MFLKPDYAKYRGRNELVAFILRRWDARTESVGLDEFNLDVTDFSTRYQMDLQDGSHENLIDEIKEEILEKACLSVSHGIGPNKLVAKISN